MVPSPARIRPMEPSDATPLSEAFAAIGWSKPVATFEGYLIDVGEGRRTAIVAEVSGRPVGYVTVAWTSGDPVLRQVGCPEIEDLNVLPDHRLCGIGSALMDEAERLAADRHPTVALRVGLHSGYGAAQRLYTARGYRLDGTGVVVDGYAVKEGATLVIDDAPTLRMFKPLGPQAQW